jgi:TonB family protein
MQNGKAVKVYFTMPITFKLVDDEFSDLAKPKARIDTPVKKPFVYTYVEKMPVSEYDYNKYLAQHLKYPEYAKEHNIYGRVIVRFVVNEDGSISDCSVVRGVDTSLNNEAVRVVLNSPKWKPAMQGGKPVKVYYTIPIVFNLVDDNVKLRR